MKDYSELKKLAGDAILGGFEEGGVFRSRCRPTVILTMIDEVERLDRESQNLSNDLGLCDRERRRLISENESLKKDAARYRWLRVNEFDIGSYHPEGDHNHESWFEHFDDQSIDRGIADEAEFAAEAMDRDEIPDFTPGNGNKARRRADELGIDYDAAMGNKE